MTINDLIKKLEDSKNEIGGDAPVVIRMHRPVANDGVENFIFDTGSPSMCHSVYYLEEKSVMIGFSVTAHQDSKIKVSVREID